MKTSNTSMLLVVLWAWSAAPMTTRTIHTTRSPANRTKMQWKSMLSTTKTMLRCEIRPQVSRFQALYRWQISSTISSRGLRRWSTWCKMTMKGCQLTNLRRRWSKARLRSSLTWLATMMNLSSNSRVSMKVRMLPWARTFFKQKNLPLPRSSQSRSVVDPSQRTLPKKSQRGPVVEILHRRVLLDCTPQRKRTLSHLRLIKALDRTREKSTKLYHLWRSAHRSQWPGKAPIMRHKEIASRTPWLWRIRRRRV